MEDLLLIGGLLLAFVNPILVWLLGLGKFKKHASISALALGLFLALFVAYLAETNASPPPGPEHILQDLALSALALPFLHFVALLFLFIKSRVRP